MRPRNVVTLTFPAQARNVEFARVAVAALAGQVEAFTLEELDDIKLAVSEAVTNAVLHAYAPPAGAGARGEDGGTDTSAAPPRPRRRRRRQIRVEVRVWESRLEVGVIDRGRGIPDIDKARRPAFTTAPGRLGMGFTIMEGLCDSLSVASTPGAGTEVWLGKTARTAALATPAGPPQPAVTTASS